MSRRNAARAATVITAALMLVGVAGCGSSSSTPSGPTATVGPTPSGSVTAAGDVAVFDAVSKTTKPFGEQSLEERQKMAAQVCDAITEKTNGNALEWIQRVQQEPDLSPFPPAEYGDLLLFASAALRYKCPGYLEQVQRSGATLTVPQG